MFSSLLNSKPIFKTSHMYLLLVSNWSAAMYGQHTKGTPLVKPSVVELHPQWLTKHETDKRANTISCGAHSAIFTRSYTQHYGIRPGISRFIRP
ncbi:hypothetical protein V6N13_099504 [Hibiscus sabdariffa]|uniref:Secreted protein n=1 Tax=Hibiscus sabdariffa TaxID=183260 RepID=A0ABR2PZV9_9ROSI